MHKSIREIIQLCKTMRFKTYKKGDNITYKIDVFEKIERDCRPGRCCNHLSQIWPRNQQSHFLYELTNTNVVKKTI
jgi:hypothetical protein